MLPSRPLPLETNSARSDHPLQMRAGKALLNYSRAGSDTRKYAAAAWHNRGLRSQIQAGLPETMPGRNLNQPSLRSVPSLILIMSLSWIFSRSVFARGRRNAQSAKVALIRSASFLAPSVGSNSFATSASNCAQIELHAGNGDSVLVRDLGCRIRARCFRRLGAGRLTRS